MPSSKLDMISAALVLIGDKPLSSLDADRVAATVAAQLYDSTLENALTGYRWRFATGKASLAQLTDTPLNDYSYAYQLPSDLLYVQRVFPTSDYELFEDNLYSNLSSVQIDYTYRPPESELPAYFVKAMEYELAAQFAISVTDSMTYFERYRAEADLAWKQARFKDSSQRPNRAIIRNPFVDVRR